MLTKIKKPALIFAATVSLLPCIASAQGARDLIQGVGRFVYVLIPLSFTVTILFFFWGLARFILKADNEAERDAGKEVMKWGIVALFIILSIWGIVAVLQGELGITGQNILFGEIFISN